MNPARPQVSIGMPVFNGVRFLPMALDSLLVQDFDDFELVISDNASTDATEEVCRAYAAQDRRIRYVRQPQNLGVCQNYNAVRQLARGTYFKWAAANDRCAPALLAECVSVLKARPEVVGCYARTRLIGEDDRPIEDYVDDLNLDVEGDSPVSRFVMVLDRLALNNIFNGVIRSATLDSVPWLGSYRGSDKPLLAALALRGKLHEVSDVLFFRRIGPASQSAIRDAQDNAQDYLFDEGMDLAKLYMGLFSAVRRAPILMSQKARLFCVLVRRLVWHRGALFAEAQQALAASRRL